MTAQHMSHGPDAKVRGSAISTAPRRFVFVAFCVRNRTRPLTVLTSLMCILHADLHVAACSSAAVAVCPAIRGKSQISNGQLG